MSDIELTPKSEPVRRLEIFTGAGRRRSWSAEQKAQIVAESLSGESVSAVARRHGLTPQQVFAWRRQARGGSVAGKGPLDFASVVVMSAAIEFEYCGALIRVSPGADVALVRSLLQALKAVA